MAALPVDLCDKKLQLGVRDQGKGFLVTVGFGVKTQTVVFWLVSRVVMQSGQGQ